MVFFIFYSLEFRLGYYLSVYNGILYNGVQVDARYTTNELTFSWLLLTRRYYSTILFTRDARKGKRYPMLFSGEGDESRFRAMYIVTCTRTGAD